MEQYQYEGEDDCNEDRSIDSKEQNGSDSSSGESSPKLNNIESHRDDSELSSKTSESSDANRNCGKSSKLNEETKNNLSDNQNHEKEGNEVNVNSCIDSDESNNHQLQTHLSLSKKFQKEVSRNDSKSTQIIMEGYRGGIEVSHEENGTVNLDKPEKLEINEDLIKKAKEINKDNIKI